MSEYGHLTTFFASASIEKVVLNVNVLAELSGKPVTNRGNDLFSILCEIGSLL